MRPCSATLLDAPPRPAPQVPIPELGAESIQEGSILSILKNAGDYVEAEGVVAEVETDKVTVEARSPHAGTIKELFVAEGDTVTVGAKFFSLAVGEGAAAAAAAPAAGGGAGGRGAARRARGNPAAAAGRRRRAAAAAAPRRRRARASRASAA